MTRCSCISSVIGNNEIPTNSTSSDSGQVLKIETIVFLRIKEMFLSKKLVLLVIGSGENNAIIGLWKYHIPNNIRDACSLLRSLCKLLSRTQNPPTAF